MTRGEVLFNTYRDCLRDQGVESDGWEDLEDTDRRAWANTAELIDFEQSDESIAKYGRWR